MLGEGRSSAVGLTAKHVALTTRTLLSAVEREGCHSASVSLLLSDHNEAELGAVGRYRDGRARH